MDPILIADDFEDVFRLVEEEAEEAEEETEEEDEEDEDAPFLSDNRDSIFANRLLIVDNSMKICSNFLSVIIIIIYKYFSFKYL